MTIFFPHLSVYLSTGLKAVFSPFKCLEKSYTQNKTKQQQQKKKKEKKKKKKQTNKQKRKEKS